MSFNFGAALAVFLAAGAAPGTNGTVPQQSVLEAVPLIAPVALKAMLASGRVLLIDVREPEEFAAGHIEGAKLVPLGTIETAYRELPRDAKMVVYCRSGKRSAKAVAFLRAHGLNGAVSLDGGFLAWSALR